MDMEHLGPIRVADAGVGARMNTAIAFSTMMRQIAGPGRGPPRGVRAGLGMRCDLPDSVDAVL